MLKKIFKALAGASTFSRLSWIKRNGTRHLAISSYQEIDGWLSLDEAKVLYDISRSLPREDLVIVEIGVWQGKSVFVLAQGIKDKPNARIFCLDPFNADSSPEEAEIYREQSRNFQIPLKQRFLDTCEKKGIMDRLEVLEGYSYEFSGSWDRPIDILFIDANHTYEAVYRDFREWSGFVREGGYLLLHDVSFEEEPGGWKDGPAEFVRRHLLNDERFVIHKFVDSLFAVKRVPVRASTGPASVSEF